MPCALVNYPAELDLTVVLFCVHFELFLRKKVWTV